METQATETSERTLRPIQIALQELELVFFSSRDSWPRPGWVDEYTSAFTRLKDLYECIDLEAARLDLLFRVEQEVRMLRDYCLWLVRRIGREVFFRTQLSLERELRQWETGAGYQLYLRLVEVQDQEREFLSLTDSQLTEHLRNGRLTKSTDFEPPVLPD